MNELIGTKAIAAHLGIKEHDAWMRIRKNLLPVQRRRIGKQTAIVASIDDLEPHRQLVGMDAVARYLNIDVRRAYHFNHSVPLPKVGANICVAPSKLRQLWSACLSSGDQAPKLP